MDSLLDVEKAAAALGTSPRFIRRLIAERRIRFYKIGKHVRIAASDLDAFVAAVAVDPAPMHDGRLPATPTRTTAHLAS